MLRTTKTALALVHLVACVVLLLTIARYIDRPLRFDESLFPAQARAILLHGSPRLSFEEDRNISPPANEQYVERYGMWHPPLYLYGLAAAIRVAGSANWVIRGFSLACFCATAFLLWRLAGVMLPGADPSWRLLPLSLAMLSPLLRDTTLYADIDNTVLAPLLLLFMLRFLRLRDITSPAAIGELSILLALTLTAKLTTPVILMGSVGLYALLGQQALRRTMAVAAITAAGAGIFAIAYLVYCWIFAYPAWFMFDSVYFGKSALYSSIKSLSAVLLAVRWHVVWLGPALAMIGGTVAIGRLARYVRIRQPEPVDLALIFSVASLVAYTLVGAMWGKYLVPGALAMTLVAGVEVAKVWPAWRIRRPGVMVACIAVIAAGAALSIVPQIRIPAPMSGPSTLMRYLIDPRNVSVVLQIAIAAGVAVAASRVWLTGGNGRSAWLAAFILSFVVSAPIIAARVMLPDYDRGPLRAGMDRGFEQVVAYLNASAKPGAVVLAPKDIGYYFEGRYYALEGLVAIRGDAGAAAIAARPDVQFAVDSTMYPVMRSPDALAGAGFDRIERIGDFQIFAKR